jgi:alcohol dehydrogenase
MKAFVIDKYGKETSMSFRDVPDPILRDDEVLVKVCAAGVNQIDAKIRNGDFKIILPYRLPFILGHDAAGIVEQVGSRVRQFVPGDKVYARLDDFRIGAFAEYAAIKESSIALMPKTLSMEEAASVPLAALTAWQALVEKAGLKKGQKIFIQAGSGGVGIFAIQLAKHIGAFVATTTSDANIDFVKNLGADLAIDYKTEDFGTMLRDYDVVLNSQDNAALMKSIGILKDGGSLISISGPPDWKFGKEMKASFLVRLILQAASRNVRRAAKRRRVKYEFLFMKPNGNQLRQIGELIDRGIIKPAVEKTFPFNKTQDALDYVEKGHAKGKVVIKISQ